MPNAFATKPEVVEPVLQRTWLCPVTGFEIPMEPDANLQWRSALLDLAEKDADLRQDLYTACSQSCEFFVNAFCFTLRVFESNEAGKQKQAVNVHVPFCLWPIQQTHVQRIVQCIEDGEELLTDKSRDMGATWDHLAVITWAFLFRSNVSGLLLSRKEDTVDQLDGQVTSYPHGSIADPGTLFGKIDYILSRLPEWMLPRMSRKKLHLVNADNASRLDGESANATAGTSDRRTFILMDEFAKVEEAESIKRSTRDVTACRLVVSTPNGAGTTFSKWRMSGTIEVFPLMWWTHPEKAKGLYVEADDLGKWKIRSPWYDHECATRSPKEVAIEIDADHVGSGEVFFEAPIIEQHKKLFARPPRQAKNIVFKKSWTDEKIVEALRSADIGAISYNTPVGPWKVWCSLINGRPDQNKTYTVSADISKGQGASNSVCTIGCNETHEKIAEYADANVPPYEFAKLVAAAALWAGGRDKRPLVIWENNGDPGMDFQRVLVRTLRYPNIYFDRQSGTLRERVGKRFGWRSNPDKKAEALGVLRRAYATGKFFNRSSLALDECLSYVHYEGGGIGPAALVSESATARKAHGDRVIADMLMTWVWAGSNGRTPVAKTSTPQCTFGHRLEQFKKLKKLNSSLPRIGSKITFAEA